MTARLQSTARRRRGRAEATRPQHAEASELQQLALSDGIDIDVPASGRRAASCAIGPITAGWRARPVLSRLRRGGRRAPRARARARRLRVQGGGQVPAESKPGAAGVGPLGRLGPAWHRLLFTRCCCCSCCWRACPRGGRGARTPQRLPLQAQAPGCTAKLASVASSSGGGGEGGSVGESRLAPMTVGSFAGRYSDDAPGARALNQAQGGGASPRSRFAECRGVARRVGQVPGR